MKPVAMAVALAGFVTFLMGCDPEHKKKCEWYLMPDTDHIKEADHGMIRVCARNFVVNKEDCRLQTTIDFAEKAYNKKFKYNDLTVEHLGTPRTISNISYCEE